MKFLQLSKRHQKNNKRGGMLVLVLMIFAVSLILISSAISITLASRSRYYVNAESSQERLTLTCAAEAVIDAIETQEFPDAKLEQAANSGLTLTITGADLTSLGGTVTANNGHSIAPGLSSDTNSKTTVTVSRISGSKDINLEFATIINATNGDNKPEKLRVRLKYKGTVPKPEICNNMVTMGEPGSNNDCPKLDMQDPRSFTVLHGNVKMSGGSAAYVRNRTVATGIVTGGSGTIYYNDVIFYGPDAGINVNSGGNGLTIQKNPSDPDAVQGSFYFLGVDYNGNSGVQHVFRDASGNPSSAANMNMIAQGAYFYNADMTVTNWTMKGQNTKYYVLGGGSTVNITASDHGNVIVKAGGSINSYPSDCVVYDGMSAVPDGDDKNTVTAISAKAAQYINETDIASAAARTIPTKDEQQEDYGSYWTGTAIAIPNGVTTGTVYDGGKTYEMSGTYDRSPSGGFGGGYITFDLTKGDAVVRIPANTTCTFTNFYVTCSNSTDNKLIVVLGAGAKLKFSDNTGSCWDGSTCGIISCDSRKSSDWKQGNTPYANLATPGQKPACYIIGMGKNEVSAFRACTLDAYISLGGTGEDASLINLGDNVHFYGRIEAVNIKQGAYGEGSDNLKIWYCPAPGEGGEGGSEKPLISKYEAGDYQYYY